MPGWCDAVSLFLRRSWPFELVKCLASPQQRSQLQGLGSLAGTTRAAFGGNPTLDGERQEWPVGATCAVLGSAHNLQWPTTGVACWCNACCFGQRSEFWLLSLKRLSARRVLLRAALITLDSQRRESHVGVTRAALQRSNILATLDASACQHDARCFGQRSLLWILNDGSHTSVRRALLWQRS